VANRPTFRACSCACGIFEGRREDPARRGVRQIGDAEAVEHWGVFEIELKIREPDRHGRADDPRPGRLP